MFYKDTKFEEKPELDKELIIIGLQHLITDMHLLTNPERIASEKERVNKQIELVKQLIK